MLTTPAISVILSLYFNEWKTFIARKWLMKTTLPELTAQSHISGQHLHSCSVDTKIVICSAVKNLKQGRCTIDSAFPKKDRKAFHCPHRKKAAWDIDEKGFYLISFSSICAGLEANYWKVWVIHEMAFWPCLCWIVFYHSYNIFGCVWPMWPKQWKS